MAGYDAPFHLSEECSNANVAGGYSATSTETRLLTSSPGPRAIIMTSLSGLVGGWAVILVIAYTVTDISVRVCPDLIQHD